ncbi:MAG: phosphoribosylanthranilate isomerase [Thiotrichales bacterium]
MRTRVKICGITRTRDAKVLVDAGVDALGLVFYPPSSRYLDVAQANEIAAAASAFVTVVGLFLDASPDFVNAVISDVQLDLLQFHGTESQEFCSAFGLPYIKAVAMKSESSFQGLTASYPDAKGFLLDSHAPGEAGGTGKRFDWSRVPANPERPLILAGGLRPENVREAITSTLPYAIDLSSGVESSPGVKDRGKIEQLMSEVRKADNDR